MWKLLTFETAREFLPPCEVFEVDWVIHKSLQKLYILLYIKSYFTETNSQFCRLSCWESKCYKGEKTVIESHLKGSRESLMGD